MRRKYITKTIISSEILAHKITVTDGKPDFEELSPVKVVGRVTERKALKEIQKQYGSEYQYAICDIKVKESLYSMSVSDFIEIATEKPITQN